LTYKNHFLIFNIGTYFGLIIVLFNYAFSAAGVNAISNNTGTLLSVVGMSIRMLVEYVLRRESVEH